MQVRMVARRGYFFAQNDTTPPCTLRLRQSMSKKPGQTCSLTDVASGGLPEWNLCRILTNSLPFRNKAERSRCHRNAFGRHRNHRLANKRMPSRFQFGIPPKSTNLFPAPFGYCVCWRKALSKGFRFHGNSSKHSSDLGFVDGLHDIVGSNMNPPAHAIILLDDEKGQIKAPVRRQPGMPIKPGKCFTITHDYRRDGATTLVTVLNIRDGTVIGRLRC